VGSNISRKDFLRSLSWLITLPFALLVGHSISRHVQVSGKKEIKISNDLNNGITFFDDIIAVKKDNDQSFFSSRCPHLGCHISSAENGELVCPCHGSRFDLDGMNLKGPANMPLQKLDYKVDTSSGEIIINF